MPPPCMRRTEAEHLADGESTTAGQQGHQTAEAKVSPTRICRLTVRCSARRAAPEETPDRGRRPTHPKPTVQWTASPGGVATAVERNIRPRAS